MKQFILKKYEAIIGNYFEISDKSIIVCKYSDND